MALDIEQILSKLGRKNLKDDIKKRIAVSLEYDKENDRAPKITAQGRGEIAEKIIEIAKLNNIPVHEDKALAEMLAELELNSFIPIEAYVTVAEILTYIYKANASRKQEN